MKTHTQTVTILLSLLTALLSSCASINEFSVTSDEHQRQFADVSLSLRYLDREELIARHGLEANPFVDYPGTVTRKQQIMVFEMEVSSIETPILIKQKNINLEFGDQRESPISEYHMKEMWVKYHSKREKDIRNRIIGQNVSQGELTADPSAPLKTYLVFVDKFPLYGDAVLSLPIMTADLKDQGIIEFPFSFDLAYIDPEKTEPGDLSPPSSDEDTEEEKKSIFE